MKIILLTSVFLLVACGHTQIPSEDRDCAAIPDTTQNLGDDTDSDDYNASKTTVGTSIQIADGLFNIGNPLFDDDIFVQGTILDDNSILMVNLFSNESVHYNFIVGEVLSRVSPEIRRLGSSHLYSQERNDDGSYLITLYDTHLNTLKQHKAFEPIHPLSAWGRMQPATDGIHILYTSYQHIIVQNANTGDVRKINSDYLSLGDVTNIWNWTFDGEWIFFSSTRMVVDEEIPMYMWSRTSGIGAYNFITSEKVIQSDFNQLFSGVSHIFDNGKALFWQCGVAHGTYGYHGIIMDANNSSMQVVDVGVNTFRISNNGRFIASVCAQAMQVNLYDTKTLELLFTRNIDDRISSNGNCFDQMSITDDGRHIFFDGVYTSESGERSYTLFMAQMFENN